MWWSWVIKSRIQLPYFVLMLYLMMLVAKCLSRLPRIHQLVIVDNLTKEKIIHLLPERGIEPRSPASFHCLFVGQTGD